MNRHISVKQTGAALLIMTLILMSAAGLIIIFAAGYSILQEKSIDNQEDSNKAAAAAEAGLDYAIAFLTANSATIKATASGGFINYSIATTTQADNSTYNAVITNPTANNYQLLQVSATGASSNGLATRTVRQQVYKTGSPVNYGVTTRGDVTTSGSGSITGSNGVRAGGAVNGSGISNSIANDSAIANMTPEAFFTSIFGGSYNTIQASSTYYANPLLVPWSLLSTTTNQAWVNGNVSLNGNKTIGTPSNPIIVIINGDLNVSGNVTFNGLVYVRGNITGTGSFVANGGVVAEGNVSLTGNAAIDYNPTILNLLTLAGSGGSTYSKVPGTWRDF